MDGPSDAAVAPQVLVLSRIEKRFGPVRALGGVSFDCRRSEIHALIGENGAGKSTLMRVLAGIYAPDAGQITVHGQPVRLAGPHDAQRLGISMVNQDTRLVPDLKVAQNIFLGREPGGALLVDCAKMEAQAARLLGRFGVPIDPAARLGDLRLGERQLVEIARALTTEPSVLILDEPTSALDGAETERLLAILADLRAGGTGIIFISHRLPEVLRIADRITVLKDGETVGTVSAKSVDESALVSMMVGRPVEVAYPPRSAAIGGTVLEIEGLTSPGRFHDVSFEVRAGEILGLGGIQGNGQADVARALFGALPASGDVRLQGRTLSRRSPRRAIEDGLIYIPGDRRREGLFLPHAIARNISVPHLPAWARYGILSPRREMEAAHRVIHDFAVRTPSAAQPVALLSGGNQQKVVLGRWTLGKPKVFIFEEPTQGVDVATKLEIYRRIRALAAEGAAILLVTSDLLELIALADRIAVFADGRVVDIVAGDDATEERIVGSAVRNPRATKADQPAAHAPARRRRGRYTSALLLLLFILLLGAVTAAKARFFLTADNLGGLAMQVAPLALAALGQLATILVGGIDLSIGPLISLVTAIASYTLAGGVLSAIGGIGLCLAAGALVGGLNVLLIEALGIPDLIATLATYSVVTGAALLVRPSPGGSVSDGFMATMTATIGPVPVAALLVLALYLIAEGLLVRGRIGARLYAIGSSREAAFVAGIPIRRVRALCYLFCSFTGVLAGLLVTARIGSGDPAAGADFTLNSITAVVVGGASIFGGRGTAVGALAGAVLIGLMQNALNYMQVSAYLQYVWIGALTLIAVAAYSIRNPLRGGSHG